MASWVVPSLCAVALLCLSCPYASGYCSHIETTYDWCRGPDTITVEGNLIIKGSQGPHTVNLAGLQRTEVRWYCGNSKERVAWGGPANQLRVYYFHNGRIIWFVYRC